MIPPVPRRVPVLTGATISHDWDLWFQANLDALNVLVTSVLSGPDADPNGIVIGSPGYLYRAMGEGVTASQLWVKESGVNTDTGWIGK